MTTRMSWSGIRGIWRSSELRDQVTAFSSHFVLNLSLFTVVIAASLMLDADEFARLSLANSYILLVAMAIDFGLNSAALKLSIEHRRRDFVEINLALKAGAFILCLGALAAWTAVAGSAQKALILTCGAASALWYAMRCLEQYDRNFQRYAALNLRLASSRVLIGGLALATKSWAIIAFAVHAIAILPVSLPLLRTAVRERTLQPDGFRWDLLRTLFSITPAFFITAALYSAVPAITQTAIFRLDDAQATGAFGIVILFVGPIALLANTLRVYLQPQIIHGHLVNVNAFGLGQGSIHVVVGGFAALLIVAIVPASYVLDWVYRDRYPLAGTFLLVYGGAACIVEALGLYNVRLFRGARIWIGVYANCARTALVALPLFLAHLSPLQIVAWSAFILLAGEIALCAILTFADREAPHDFPSALEGLDDS